MGKSIYNLHIQLILEWLVGKGLKTSHNGIKVTEFLIYFCRKLEWLADGLCNVGSSGGQIAAMGHLQLWQPLFVIIMWSCTGGGLMPALPCRTLARLCVCTGGSVRRCGHHLFPEQLLLISSREWSQIGTTTDAHHANRIQVAHLQRHLFFFCLERVLKGIMKVKPLLLWSK